MLTPYPSLNQIQTKFETENSLTVADPLDTYKTMFLSCHTPRASANLRLTLFNPCNKKSKPSFYSGSCDEIHATKKIAKQNFKIGSCMVTFDRGWKPAMKLARLAVRKSKLPMWWKPAIKLPRSAVWDHSAEKRPWNYKGRQLENMPLIMDSSNGWKAAMKLPRFEDQKTQSAENRPSNCQGRQFYGHFFKLPNMAGLPKCIL